MTVQVPSSSPRVYDSNNIIHLQQLLVDLNSISGNGGGDNPEYGLNGILRASTISDPYPFNHIFCSLMLHQRIIT